MRLNLPLNFNLSLTVILQLDTQLVQNNCVQMYTRSCAPELYSDCTLYITVLFELRNAYLQEAVSFQIK